MQELRVSPVEAIAIRQGQTLTRSIGRPEGNGDPPADLPWLTMIRFVPALWVMVYHADTCGLLSPTWSNATPAFVVNVVRHGFLGVPFFFLLSGFILSHVYGGKTSLTPRSFLEARIARLYPLHLLGLLLGAYRLPLWFRDHEKFHSPNLAHLLAFAKSFLVLALGQAWWGSAALFWNFPSWSLSAEMFFYACFPFVLPWMRRRSKAGIWSVLAGCILVLTIIELVGLHFSVNGYNPLIHFPVFLVGIGLQQLVRRGVVLHPIVAIPSLALFWFSLSGIIPRWLCHGPMMAGIGGIVVGLSRPEGSGSGGPPRHVGILLGQASFAMYLLHIPLLWFFLDFVPLEGTTRACVCFVTVLLVSILAFQYIETPSRIHLRRLFESLRRRGTPTESTQPGRR